MKCLKLWSCMCKFGYFYIFNHHYFGRSKSYFFSSNTREKLRFWGAIVGVRAQIGIMGLAPYSRTWIHPRRSKWVGDAQSVELHKEKMKGYSPRSLHSSDTKNIDQADIWAVFTERWTVQFKCRIPIRNLRLSLRDSVQAFPSHSLLGSGHLRHIGGLKKCFLLDFPLR